MLPGKPGARPRAGRQGAHDRWQGWLTAAVCGVVAALWSLLPGLHARMAHREDACVAVVSQAHEHRTCSAHAHHEDASLDHSHDAEHLPHHDEPSPAHDERHPCSTCDLILLTAALGGTLDAPVHALFVTDAGEFLAPTRDSLDSRRVLCALARGPPARA